MKRGLFFTLLVGAWLAVYAVVQAAPLSSLRLQMSRQTVGAAANQQYDFTVGDSVDTVGDTITLTFASGFVLTTLTASDVALFHGVSTGLETQETIASSAAAGVWGVAVAGQVLTLTPPTDVGAGEIASSEKVVIRLGTNAGGIHQISNPGTAGTYEVAIGGGFGGTGLVRVPIVTAANGGFGVAFSVPVTATATPPTPDAGGGAAGAAAPPPVVPPPEEPLRPVAIGDVSISAITMRSAHVHWSTDRAGSTYVVVRDGVAADRTVASTPEAGGYGADLSGLTPGFDYTVTIYATASGALPGSAGPTPFRTLSEGPLENVSDFSGERTTLDPTRVHLHWVFPSTLIGSGAEVVIVARTDRFPTGIADGRTVYTGGDTVVDDTPGRGAVFYAAFVRLSGRVSSGAVTSLPALAAVIPPPVTPPTTPPTTPPVTEPTTPATPPTTPAGSTPPTTPSGSSSGTAGSSGGTTEPLPGVTPLVPSAPGGFPEGTTSTPTSPVLPTTPVGATTSTVGTPASFSVSWEWRTQDGRLVLGQGNQTPRVLAGDNIQLVVIASQEMVSGQVRVDGSLYALSRAEGQRYVTVFIPAEAVGTVTAEGTMRSAGGDERRLTGQIEVVSPVQVYEQDTLRQPADRAQVALLVWKDGAWVPYAGARTSTTALGGYRQYVPAGRYRLEARKEGWRTMRQDISLTSAGPLQGTLVLEKGIQNPLAALDPTASVTENIANVAAATAETVTQVVEAVRTPETQAVAQVAVPVAVVATAGAAAAAASSFNVFAYLRFLFLQPSLLWGRRRREKWGLVYNALTKQPVDLAIVRLLDAKTGMLRQTRITDAQGRFAFLAAPGSYRLEVVKPGFAFPSQTLAQEKMDIDLVDLYHGEEVQAQTSATLTPNIPIDPLEKVEVPKTILTRKRWRRAQSALSIGSLVVAGLAVVIQPTVSMVLLAGAQIAAFFLFRRLAVPAKPKNWGIVYDKLTRKPLGRVIVRIFDKKYNKLLETQLTDGDGKYAFFAGKNIYYVTADHPSYDRFVSKEIDLRKEALGVIREPLALQTKTVPPAAAT